MTILFYSPLELRIGVNGLPKLMSIVMKLIFGFFKRHNISRQWAWASLRSWWSGLLMWMWFKQWANSSDKYNSKKVSDSFIWYL